MPKAPDTATRARRLLALLPLLEKGATIPISELASAVGAPVEEVAADLATLTLCGVPPFSPFDMIELDIDGDSVTVYVEPPALDKPVRLTTREARALTTALEAAGYPADSAIMRKLAPATAPDVSAADLERTIRAGAAPGGLADVYASMALAADEHRKARIEYLTGSTGRVVERTVHPWALVNRLGVWYAVALCEMAREERVFRLDRVRAIEVLAETFEPPALVPLAVSPSPETLPIAEIRFATGVRLPDDKVWPGAVFEAEDDGTTYGRIPYQSLGWIARRIAAFMGDAEVIAPAPVRDAVRHLAEDMLRDMR